MGCSLALDASSERSFASLVTEGGELFESVESSRASNDSALLSLTDSLIEKAGISSKDIDRILVGLGPGSFTGLRLVLTFARGLAYALHAELKGVPSFDGAAQVASQNFERFVVVADARRDELFAAAYGCDQGNLSILFEQEIISKERLQDVVSEHSVTHCFSFFDISSKDLGVSGLCVEPVGHVSTGLLSDTAKGVQFAETDKFCGLEPCYLREFQALKLSERKPS